MKRIHIISGFSISAQLHPNDVAILASKGVKSIICNRPDGESNNQPSMLEIKSIARKLHIKFIYIPISTGKISDQQIDDFQNAFEQLPKPLHAYCKTGTRSMTLWSLMKKRMKGRHNNLVSAAKLESYDIKMKNYNMKNVISRQYHYDVVIVGAGTAGIAAATKLLEKRKSLSIAIIEPSAVRYQQSRWALVGNGMLKREKTIQTMISLMPKKITWINAAVTEFEPQNDYVVLENSQPVFYRRLIVAPGVKFDWNAIDGLVQTLGHNGVTSNYRFDLAPYTWQLVKSLKSGHALFTQPYTSLNCATTAQNSLYLSSHYWCQKKLTNEINIESFSAMNSLFGVKKQIPLLKQFIDMYGIESHYSHNLIKISGNEKTAWFKKENENGYIEIIEKEFDMIHVCPPQCPYDFIKNSPLTDDDGWIDVDPSTLQHKHYLNIWSLGDAINTKNAKTPAAAKMQASVVANNLLEDMGIIKGIMNYNGYSASVLTVKRGKAVLSEFDYEGQPLPSFLQHFISNKKPSTIAWWLKNRY